MHMVSSSFNCSVDDAPSEVQMELIESLTTCLIAGILLLPERGKLFTPEEACSEDPSPL